MISTCSVSRDKLVHLGSKVILGFQEVKETEVQLVLMVLQDQQETRDQLDQKVDLE